MSRFLAREVAFKAIFQLDINHGDGEERKIYEDIAIDTVINTGKKLSEEDQLYVAQTVRGTRSHLEEIDQIISAHLKKSWTLQRLATVDRNILRLAIY